MAETKVKCINCKKIDEVDFNRTSYFCKFCGKKNDLESASFPAF